MTMPILPVLLKDGYKVGHKFQYPDDTTQVYSNFTARKSRVEGFDSIVSFGMQYFVEEYLIRQFNQNFFERGRKVVMDAYKRRINNYLGKGAITYDHIERLWQIGYLPLRIKAIPEGLLVPCGVPVLTVTNTQPEFFWLPNMLETLLSNVLWGPMTSATTAFRYRRAFELAAMLTGGDRSFVKWQGHDFSYRGLMGQEAAMLSGAAHLLSFTGTDTIPAIDFLEEYYKADSDKELIGGSVPATEHSVMSMGGENSELDTIRRLITKVVPKGIISIVSDTWDFWQVVTEFLPQLRDTIMQRDGKVVIRPDSGDPVKIICGDPDASAGTPQHKGAIQCLWDIFGGTTTANGYRVLDLHIGLIYGDSITPERQGEILTRLIVQGFASTNVVLGIGSYTYQHVTRDTYGFAMKATYGETRNSGGRAIFKTPKTDNGTKNSARGLLRVERGDLNGRLLLGENCDWVAERCGVLRPIFIDGTAQNVDTLATIRARIEAQL